MAKFTVDQPINIRWNGLDIQGSGATHRIPDALLDEFLSEVEPHIAGTVTWITQDETSSIPSFPIAQSDVSSLVSDLAALTVRINANSSTIANKFDKSGGIISGATTVTSTLNVNGDATVGGVVLNGGSFVNPYDTDVWIAPANRSNPGNLSQAIYAQLRVSGSMASQVMDGAAIELRLNGISNASFLNAIESSIVITGGANTIPNVRSITGNMVFEGTPTGTVTTAIMLAAQNLPDPGSVTVTNAYSVYAEQQTRATNNWNVYAPGGNSLFGMVKIEQAAGAVADLQFGHSANLRWVIRKNGTAESGSNAGSDLEIMARTDAGAAVGTALTITRSNIGIKLGTGPLGFFGTTPVAKKTGWGAATGTATRTTFATGSVTTAQLAERVKALIDDLLAYGLISA